MAAEPEVCLMLKQTHLHLLQPPTYVHNASDLCSLQWTPKSMVAEPELFSK